VRHCSQFNAEEIYFLEDNDLYCNRTLSIGYCPICGKPVAELKEFNFAGGMNKVSVSGIHAQNMMLKVQNEIKYSSNQVNYRKVKSKPYGWKYGINKQGKNDCVRQYACDFYGNKELIKK